MLVCETQLIMRVLFAKRNLKLRKKVAKRNRKSVEKLRNATWRDTNCTNQALQQPQQKVAYSNFRLQLAFASLRYDGFTCLRARGLGDLLIGGVFVELNSYAAILAVIVAMVVEAVVFVRKEKGLLWSACVQLGDAGCASRGERARGAG